MTNDPKTNETDPKKSDLDKEHKTDKDAFKEKYGVEPGKPYEPIPGDPAKQ